MGYVAGGLVTALLLVTGLGAMRWQEQTEAEGSSVPVEWQRPAVAASELPDRLGIRLTRVAVTGQGGLLDLRFQVVDPDKAAAIHDPKTPPAIVDEASGLVVHRLFMDHSHSGAYTAAVSYYLVFESTANWVHRGGRVTVVLGNIQVEHVVVV